MSGEQETTEATEAANTKRLKELVRQDRELRTGPARRAEIRTLLETNLDTEAMVEVLAAQGPRK